MLTYHVCCAKPLAGAVCCRTMAESHRLFCGAIEALRWHRGQPWERVGLHTVVREDVSAAAVVEPQQGLFPDVPMGP
jgi:hypothetical protein